MSTDLELLQEYTIPVPRYTSYPTVPFWDLEKFDIADWKNSIRNAYWANAGEVSLYIHLPYCESLCTYCGCNTIITKNHAVEDSYLNYLLKEWMLYVQALPGTPILKELHIGGGTPTFFQPNNLEKLIQGILDHCEVSKETEMSFEGHPANTTREHLEALYQLGFRRMSLGIQDFDEAVQKQINRRQSYEDVQQVTSWARAIGFKSINYDLIYGLPKQTAKTVADTLEKTIQLRPDRIAFYSYAHVPWMKPGQKSFEHLLPSGEEKLSFFLAGKQQFAIAGYKEVGMDHFVLPADELYKAKEAGDLHRNFMGYTTQRTEYLIGLGVSSIGDSWSAFGQNHKNIKAYRDALDQGEFPIAKGHLHTKEDLFLRGLIRDIMCNGKVEWKTNFLEEFGLDINWDLMDKLVRDEVIRMDEFGMKINLDRMMLLRNVCSVFDVRLWRSKGGFDKFSKAI